MKTKIFLSIALLGACSFYACKKMDSTYLQYVVPDGIVYPGKASSASVKSGINKVQLSWLRGADPKVVKARIFWNNFTDSVEVPIAANQPVISYTVTKLEENFYSFTIKTYDKEGRSSVPVEVSGAAWGERYRSTLLNRAVTSSTLDIANSLSIQFEALLPNSTVVKSQVEYTTTSGAVKIVDVLPTSVNLKLTDYKPETSYKLRTQYLEANSIDAIYTNDVAVDNFSLNKSEWTIAAFSSVYTDGTSVATNMIDGNPTTRWISQVTPVINYPHFVTVDLKVPRTIKTVSLWRWVTATPDERGPNEVQYQGSTDNVNWIDMGTYSFDRLTNNEQVVTIPDLAKIRYLKVVPLSGPQTFVVLGEVNVSVK